MRRAEGRAACSPSPALRALQTLSSLFPSPSGSCVVQPGEAWPRIKGQERGRGGVAHPGSLLSESQVGRGCVPSWRPPGAGGHLLQTQPSDAPGPLPAALGPRDSRGSPVRHRPWWLPFIPPTHSSVNSPSLNPFNLASLPVPSVCCRDTAESVPFMDTDLQEDLPPLVPR